MSNIWEIIGVVSGVFFPTVTVVGAWVKGKNNEIKILKAKIEAQEETIMTLRLDNNKLEVIGIAINRFFSQLPKGSKS